MTESNHVESFSASQDVWKEEVHASMKPEKK